jgi:hypothetical protein
MVPSPWVSTWRGTSCAASKKRALSGPGALARVLIRVVDASDELGSLNPMWPLVPMPEQLHRDRPGAVSSCSYSRRP